MTVRPAILSLVLLAGCATSGPMYIPPAGDDVATLKVINRTDMDLRPAQLTERCRRYNFYFDEKDRFTPNSLPPFRSVTVVIPAGSEFTWSAWLTRNNVVYSQSCGMVLSFTPNRGSEYHAIMRKKGRKCYLSLEESPPLPDRGRRAVKARMRKFSPTDYREHNCR